MSTDPTDIACKFTARIERDGGRYVVEVPRDEIEYGTLSAGDVCRISVEAATSDGDDDRGGARTQEPSAPVSVGERRTVEIEDLGDEGDGITRVEGGYVLIVPEADPGDEVTVEIDEVTATVGFAEVVEEAADDGVDLAEESAPDTV